MSSPFPFGRQQVGIKPSALILWWALSLSIYLFIYLFIFICVCVVVVLITNDSSSWFDSPLKILPGRRKPGDLS